jgi:hypothetical protein
MSTYTQDINNLINIIETNIPDNTSQAIKAKNVRDAMESIAYNYDLYALKTDLEGKQDVLVSGENIKTINDASILGPGNIEISGGATLVECTQAEYEEMEQAGTLDPNAIYIITDAQPQNFVSKTELDAMSYITMSDVSACGYITTNDVSQMGYITSIPEEYATYDAISQMGYITNSALNGYATESYVVEKINEIPAVDLSSYVTKDYLSQQAYLQSIPSEYVTESELDAMGYATQAYVMDRISEIPAPDLSSYVTKDYLSQQSYLQSVPSEYITESELVSTLSSYITESELNGMGYVTNTQLDDTLGSYITQEELSANGYLTQHQSLDGYATQYYVVDYVASYGGTKVVEVTQAQYDAMQQAGTLDPDVVYIITDAQPTNFVTHDELSNMSYATQAYVMDRISEIPTVDLSSYVTKDYLSNQGYITSIPNEYVTQTELSANGYLTSSSLDGYATQSYVQNYVSSYGGTKVVEVTQAQYDAMQQAGTLDPDVVYIITDAQPQNVVTHTELEAMSYVTQNYLSNQGYITVGDVSQMGYITSIPSEYITETELSGMGYLTQTQLSANGYLTSSSLNGYATQSYVVDYVASYGGTKVVEVTQAQYDAMQQAGTLDQDVVYIITDAQPQNVVTHTELEAMSYVTQNYLSNQGYITSIPNEYITQTELSANGYLTSIPSQYITETKLSGMGYLTQAQLSANGYLTSIPSQYITQTELSANGYLTSIPSQYITETELSGMGYLTQAQLSANGYLTSSSLTDYATKSYVENYVASYAGGGSVVSCTQAQYDAWQQAGTLQQDTIYVITDSNPHDLSYYVEKEELYAMGYATEAYVVDYVASHGGTGGTIDLSSYVTHDFLSQQAYLQSIPAQYITESELSGMSYLTQAQLSANGYITSADMSGFAKVHEMTYNQYNQLSYVDQHNGDIYVLTDRQYDFDPSYYVTVADLNAASYVNESYVRNYVSSYGGTKVVEVTQAEYNALEQQGKLDPNVVYIITDATPQDLSYYVTISYLETWYYPKSYVDEHFITKSYLDNYYISKTELEAAGYLTSSNFEYDDNNNVLKIKI